MFQDVELSRECQAAFLAHCHQQQDPSSSLSQRSQTATASSMEVEAEGESEDEEGSPQKQQVAHISSVVEKGYPDMNIQVLTTGYWPAAPSTTVLVLPPELQ